MTVLAYLRQTAYGFKPFIAIVIAVMLVSAAPVAAQTGAGGPGPGGEPSADGGGPPQGGAQPGREDGSATGLATTQKQGDSAPGDPLPLTDTAPADGGIGSPTTLSPNFEPTLNLVATLKKDGEPITFGLVWRVYSTRPNENGQYPLITKTDEALPSLKLAPGSYIVHAAYGRAQATANVVLSGEPVTQTVDLEAGGLRLWADLGRGARSSVSNVKFQVYSSEQDDYGDRKLIAETKTVGKVIRLPQGTYHIVSQYGDANAIERVDVKVESGKITDATIIHRAA
ncbi:MAG: hypothetical protein KDJ77_04095, partial [Rhodobiaceae bacterium]|nr:hypothetical protein [Rhodobiaceae bacterium]